MKRSIRIDGKVMADYKLMKGIVEVHNRKAGLSDEEFIVRLLSNMQVAEPNIYKEFCETWMVREGVEMGIKAH